MIKPKSEKDDEPICLIRLNTPRDDLEYKFDNPRIQSFPGRRTGWLCRFYMKSSGFSDPWRHAFNIVITDEALSRKLFEVHRDGHRAMVIKKSEFDTYGLFGVPILSMAVTR